MNIALDASSFTTTAGTLSGTSYNTVAVPSSGGTYPILCWVKSDSEITVGESDTADGVAVYDAIFPCRGLPNIYLKGSNTQTYTLTWFWE
jgi:hypothetical protein